MISIIYNDLLTKKNDTAPRLTVVESEQGHLTDCVTIFLDDLKIATISKGNYFDSCLSVEKLSELPIDEEEEEDETIEMSIDSSI